MNHRLRLVWLPHLLLLISAVTSKPSYAQPNQQQSSPSPTTTTESTPAHKFQNAFGVWLGPKVIYTTEGVYFARHISPYLMLEVGTGLPLSPYNFGSSHIFFDPESSNPPFSLSSHQQIRVVSGRAQIAPWHNQPHQPTTNSEHFFFYITLDMSHQTINYSYTQSRDRNMIEENRFGAIGGGTTGGMGYHFQPKPKIFLSLSYMLFAYHRLLLINTDHELDDELQAVLRHKHSTTKLFLYLNPLHNLFMLSLSAGYML